MRSQHVQSPRLEVSLVSGAVIKRDLNLDKRVLMEPDGCWVRAKSSTNSARAPPSIRSGALIEAPAREPSESRRRPFKRGPFFRRRERRENSLQ